MHRYEHQTSFKVETQDQYFYDRHVGIVIHCSDYTNVKTADGSQRFSDMPEVVQEAEDMIKGLKKMNFEIIHKENPDAN